MYTQLKNLLHNIVEDEQTEDHLTAEDEEIPRGDISYQFDRSYLVGGDCSTSRWEFNYQPERSTRIFGRPMDGLALMGIAAAVYLYLMTQNMLMFAL